MQEENGATEESGNLRGLPVEKVISPLPRCFCVQGVLENLRLVSGEGGWPRGGWSVRIQTLANVRTLWCIARWVLLTTGVRVGFPNVVRLNASLSYATPINDEAKRRLCPYHTHTHTHTHTHSHTDTDMWAMRIHTNAHQQRVYYRLMHPQSAPSASSLVNSVTKNRLFVIQVCMCVYVCVCVLKGK